MEQPNVNNLNGIPNFGHGFPENQPDTQVPAEEVDTISEAPMEDTSVDEGSSLSDNNN